MAYVSIGMPVRNGERFIGQALDSIVAQTFDDFELLISDNASTDKTPEICRDYATKDSRIRYVRNATDIGASHNYNHLFALSTGRYFRWAPSDDLFAPTSIERCVAVLEGHKDVVLCYPKTTLIDESGCLIEQYEDNLDLRSRNVGDRFRSAIWNIRKVNAIYGLMRTDVLRRTGLIGNYPGADADLLIELSLYGRFFEIPEALFFRRMHAEAYSSIQTIQGKQSFFDPKTCGRIHLSHWRRSFQRLVSVWHAPLKIPTQVYLSCILARAAVTARREFVLELMFGLREMMRRRFSPHGRIGTM